MTGLRNRTLKKLDKIARRVQAIRIKRFRKLLKELKSI